MRQAPSGCNQRLVCTQHRCVECVFIWVGLALRSRCVSLKCVRVSVCSHLWLRMNSWTVAAPLYHLLLIVRTDTHTLRGDSSVLNLRWVIERKTGVGGSDDMRSYCKNSQLFLNASLSFSPLRIASRPLYHHVWFSRYLRPQTAPSLPPHYSSYRHLPLFHHPCL